MLTLGATHATSGEDHVLTTALFIALSLRYRAEVGTRLMLVTLVGNQLAQAVGACKNVFARSQERTVRMICHGASDNNLSTLLPTDNTDNAVKALRYRLFEQRLSVIYYQRQKPFNSVLTKKQSPSF